ncbi:MAG: hypothetical protein IT259_10585 [Saprospiraceae bacterium]|nr:hypothetical protein [Saprospiraceae bacterium]
MRLLLFLSALLASPFLPAQNYDQILSVPVAATVSEGPNAITLHWQGSPDATGFLIHRKNKTAQVFFTQVASLPAGSSIWTDTNVQIEVSYEYRVQELGTGGAGYINSGLSLPVVQFRGRAIVVVESGIAAALEPELDQFIADLDGDGWATARIDVPASMPVSEVKQLIVAAYQQNPDETRAVCLVGHVPVPYSGNIYPDGHPDHQGAWPSDGYYGDMNGLWTDNSVNSTVAGATRHHNVPGDGKFDQSSYPSLLELQVGRIDFANLPAFPLGEVELLRRYFQKNHAWRHKQFTATARGAIENNFAGYAEGFAQSGWKNFAPLVGIDSVRYFDWDGLKNEDYLWIYGCGGGWYQGASGITTTPQLANDTLHAVFAMTFGSYFGDWDSEDNLLRATLASPGSILTNAWAGRPNWQFHHMGMGETVGYGALITQNNQGAYVPGFGGGQVHMALMGDPTLRMTIVAPPQDPVIADIYASNIALDFGESPDTAVLGYLIYRRLHGDSIWFPLLEYFTTESYFIDSCLNAGIAYDYMIKALKLETTPSGTYFNLSQGLVVENLAAPESPAVPNVSFDVFLTTGPLGALFEANVSNCSSWAWDFGDGTTSDNDTSIVHFYTAGVFIVTLTGYGECGQVAIATDTVYMSSSTAEQFRAAGWHLMPNPASEALWLENRGESMQQAVLRIFAADGRLVMQHPGVQLAPGERLRTPVNNWPEGLYLLDLQTDQGHFARPFMVQH